MTLNKFTPSLASRFPPKDRFAIITNHYMDVSVMDASNRAEGTTGSDSDLMLEHAERVNKWFIETKESIDYLKQTIEFMEAMAKALKNGDLDPQRYVVHITVILLGRGEIKASHLLAGIALSRFEPLGKTEGAARLWVQKVEKNRAEYIRKITELMMAKQPVPEPEEVNRKLSPSGDDWDWIFDAALAADAVYEYMERFHGADFSHKKILPGDIGFDIVLKKVRTKWDVGEVQKRMWELKERLSAQMMDETKG